MSSNYVKTADLTELSMRFKSLAQQAWDRAIAGPRLGRDECLELTAESLTWEKAHRALNTIIVERKVKL